jgi:hypothetical protein
LLEEREESDTNQTEQYENEVEVLVLDTSIKPLQPKQTLKSFD